ncbi:hypothetical protein R2R32_16295 [Clostridium perfringens]|nr:hypothetical protein [Clostridium perfringens]
MKGSSGPVRPKKPKRSTTYTLSLYLGWSSIFASTILFYCRITFFNSWYYCLVT